MRAIDQLDLEHLPIAMKAFGDDPYPYLDKARARHDWLASSDIGYVITGYQAIDEIMRQDDKLAMPGEEIVDIMGARGTGWGDFAVEQMLVDSGERHARLRGAVGSAFLPGSVKQLRPIMRETVKAICDEWVPKGAFDFTEFAAQFPVRVMFKLLGTSTEKLPWRGGGDLNSSETTPAGLYQRVFGLGFKDPNSATFTPDPQVMARRSVLSAVADQRAALDQAVGAADRQKLDQYYTSVRQLENQLDIELTKPQPLQACLVPGKIPANLPTNGEIETVMMNHQLMTDMLVMALACDQTRVFNMMFNNGASSLTRIGSTVTHHQLTHEEVLDNKLGYQPQATYFLTRIMEAWVYFVGALDKVKEGDGTLLDHTLAFAHSETEFAKFHTIDNIPMMTAGSGGGRIKTGIYVDGQGTPVSRVGLTLQQAMGVPLDTWGGKSMETNKSLHELLA